MFPLPYILIIAQAFGLVKTFFIFFLGRGGNRTPHLTFTPLGEGLLNLLALVYVFIIAQVWYLVKRVFYIFFRDFFGGVPHKGSNLFTLTVRLSVSLPLDNYYYTLFFRNVNRFFKSYLFNNLRRPGGLHHFNVVKSLFLYC